MRSPRSALVAGVLRIYMAIFVGDGPNAPLFPGKRASRVEPDTLRRDLWNPVIEKLFLDGHDLHGLDLHDLRRTGTSMWLRRRMSANTVAEFGGWESKKVMLDVYDAVVPDDKEYAMWLLSNRRSGERSVIRPELTITDRSALAAEIWRFRRLLRDPAFGPVRPRRRATSS